MHNRKLVKFLSTKMRPNRGQKVKRVRGKIGQTKNCIENHKTNIIAPKFVYQLIETFEEITCIRKTNIELLASSVASLALGTLALA